MPQRGQEAALHPSSVNGPNHHAHALHGVGASPVVSPEDAVLEFTAVDTPSVPHSVEVGLAASVVPPASFMEVRAVTCGGGVRESHTEWQ